MPRHEQFADGLFGLPHIQTQLYYPVLARVGLLSQDLARWEMDKDPKLRQFGCAAAGQALGHAEFLEIMQGMG
ncbi:MAG: hypothetical protein MO846_00265 [Candidatus Devosia symbiotica]|nr:hypothetical protein [Candidatus Devosia symbiotica]